jgi:hypothetical protein
LSQPKPERVGESSALAAVAVSGPWVRKAGVTEEPQQGWLVRMGLVHPPRGVPRSPWARILAPGRDSSRSDLKKALGIFVAIVVLFAMGAVLATWVGRIFDICLIVIYSLHAVRTVRLLRQAPPDPA